MHNTSEDFTTCVQLLDTVLFICTSVGFLYGALFLFLTFFTLLGAKASIKCGISVLKSSRRSLTESRVGTGVDGKDWINNSWVFSVIYSFLIEPVSGCWWGH